MARYSLVVLKVPLNINQPTNLSKQKLCFVRPIVGWDMWKNLVATLEHYERWPDEICLASHAVNLRSSSNCDLVVPRTSRKIGDRTFSVAAPHAWNRLPTDLKLLRSTASFKSKLKSLAAYTGNSVWTLECTIGLLVGGALQVTVVTVTVSLTTIVVFLNYYFDYLVLIVGQTNRHWSR